MREEACEIGVVTFGLCVWCVLSARDTRGFVEIEKM